MQALCQIAASEAGYRLWRNNVGTAWRGEVVKLHNGNLLIKRPYLITFGLAAGSADLIGIGPGGRFVSIEAKRSKRGRTAQEQLDWAAMVASCGGISAIVRSPEECLRALAGAHPLPGSGP